MSIAFLPAPDLPKKKLPKLRKAALSEFIQSLCFMEEQEAGNITVIFCDDRYLLSLNSKYLGHKTLTDIITFDYTANKSIKSKQDRQSTTVIKTNGIRAGHRISTTNPELSGDIFISTERVSENASKFKVSFEHELHRVIFHGVLHLCGYKDKTSKAKKEMTAKEDYYLSLYFK
mgnify:FL=1